MKKTVSILKERRNGERRVILTPQAIPQFVAHGYRVAVERDAGASVGYSDQDYADAGASIVSQNEAWAEAAVVFKYKAPGPEEWEFFRPNLAVASFMHAEGNLAFTEAMRASGITSYALEFCKTADGEFPVPVSDNEISGKLAVILAAYHLQATHGGRGVLLSKVPGVDAPKVVVIGYGNAGAAAAQLSAAMGASVTVFGTRQRGLRRIQSLMPPNVVCQINTKEALEKAVLEADVVIGAILISTYDTPPMLDALLVKKMKRGAVIVDVTCGYGSGYMPTFDKLTFHDSPFYEKYGVLHCKIDAMPASVPLTAAPATSYNVAPYLLGIAEDVVSNIPDFTSRSAIVTKAFEVIHPEVLRHIELVKMADK
jgi:alanine dehydrogenase